MEDFSNQKPTFVSFQPYDPQAMDTYYMRFYSGLVGRDREFVMGEIRSMLRDHNAFDPDSEQLALEVSLATKPYWINEKLMRTPVAKDPRSILRDHYEMKHSSLLHAIAVYRSSEPIPLDFHETPTWFDLLEWYRCWRCNPFMRKYWFLDPMVGMSNNLINLAQLGHRILGNPLQYELREGMEVTKLEYLMGHKSRVLKPEGAEHILACWDAALGEKSAVIGPVSIDIPPIDQEDLKLLREIFQKVADREYSAFVF